MAAVLVLTGGPDHAHDFDATGEALADILRDAGNQVDVVDDPDRAAHRLSDPDGGSGYDALVVNALRWRMLGDKYDPWREQWGYTTSELTRQAITEFVARGGGLVGNHTASICFDDWPQWGDVLGGAWNWDRSSHPPPGEVRITVERTHPVVDGLAPGFELVDEIYGDLDMRPRVTTLATAPRSPDDDPQPVVWVHDYGRGRVVYDAFGHDVASLTDAHHARLLRQAVEWVCERERGVG